MGAIQTVHDGWNHNDIVKDGYSHKLGWHNGKIVWAKDFFSFKTLDSMISEDGEVVREGSITLNITDQVLIDWGDGTETHKSDRYTIQHTYPTSDMTEYTVKIYGVITVFTGYINIDGKTCSCITEILSPMQKTMTISKWNQTFTAMFSDCITLKKIPSNLFERFRDTENVNANGMFGYSGLEEIPVGLFYGMKNIQIHTTFNGCNNLKTISQGVFTGGTFVTNGVEPIGYCENLISVYDYPPGMFPSFEGCTSLEIIGCSFSGLKSFYRAFRDITSLKEVTPNIFSQCKDATTFEECFRGCKNLVSVPKGLFEGLEKVTTYKLCFSECYNLRTIPEGLFSSAYECETFYQCFLRCYVLEAIPVGVFDNCYKATQFFNAFALCYALESVPMDLFDDCPDTAFYTSAFLDCSGITSSVPELWLRAPQDAYGTNCYEGCVNAANYDDIPSAWK